MFSKYTFLLVTNFLIANHVLGVPPKLESERTEGDVGAPSSSAQVPTEGNAVASSSSAPVPTEGDVDERSKSISQLTDEEWLKLSFADCRRYVKMRKNEKHALTYVHLNDLLDYFGNYSTIIRNTMDYLNTNRISAARRERIYFPLFSELVRAHCNPPRIPISEFVKTRWVGPNPNVYTNLDESIVFDYDTYQDTEEDTDQE